MSAGCMEKRIGRFAACLEKDSGQAYERFEKICL